MKKQTDFSHPWFRIHLIALVLIVLAALTAQARAGDFPNERKGLLLGFNLGSGSSTLDYEFLGVEVERELEQMTSGAFRIGYGFSDHLALTLEAHAWGKSTSEIDVQGFDSLIMLTWYPGGNGFFLRGGVGGGVADVKLLGPPQLINWEERESDAAGGFGLGYEWRLGRQFALGIALDAQVMHFEDLPLIKETFLGHGSASVQLNWYL